MYDAECNEIDAFIGAYKSLDGIMPPWINHYHRHHQVRWAILDSNLIQYAELCVTIDRQQRDITFCAIHRQRLFYRLDIVPEFEVHNNPYGAFALGLPPFVEGPHVHGWPDSREYVRLNGFGTLPYRRQIDGLTQTLSDGLAWVANDLKIMVTGEQRVCHLPEKGLL